MRQAVRLQQVYETYRDRADFHWVYIREAHAIDGPRPSRTVQIKQPTTDEEREAVATNCAEAIDLRIPLLIDDIEDTVMKAYDAWPDRLFIINSDGRISYRGGRGPGGFNVAEMERALQGILE